MWIAVSPRSRLNCRQTSASHPSSVAISRRTSRRRRPILQEAAQDRPEFLLLVSEAEFHGCCSSPARELEPPPIDRQFRNADQMRCASRLCCCAGTNGFVVPHVNDCISVHRLQATSLETTAPFPIVLQANDGIDGAHGIMLPAAIARFQWRPVGAKTAQ